MDAYKGEIRKRLSERRYAHQTSINTCESPPWVLVCSPRVVRVTRNARDLKPTEPNVHSDVRSGSDQGRRHQRSVIMAAVGVKHRRAPTLLNGLPPSRPYQPRGVTPQSLIDQYMAIHSPRGNHQQANDNRSGGQPPGSAMDPKSWWKLYVLETNVRSAATMHQSFSPKRQAWVDSLRSPRSSDTPRSHPRSAPQLTPGTARSLAESFAIASEYASESMWETEAKRRAAWRKRMKPDTRDVAMQCSPPPTPPGGWPQHRPAPRMKPKPTPVSKEEVNTAQTIIKGKFTDRFKSLTRAFKTADADRSGDITREEFDTILSTLNLSDIRKPVIDALCALIDVDANGCFDFNEFARILTVPDLYKTTATEEVNTSWAEVQQLNKRNIEVQEGIAAARQGMTIDEYREYYSVHKGMTF